MPRQVRIQYPGAIYHVMARGDRREAIFRDEDDRRMFLSTLGDACGRTGWLCHAYVLMGNHYHLVIETPEPNLVAGMGWLQNAYTRRHNVRHRLWGHVFGGRYKAVLVDGGEGNYLGTLIDYVHLNPARAGLAGVKEGLEVFPWSSLSYYLKSPARRKPWEVATRGLSAWRRNDDAKGRRSYLEHLETRVKQEGVEAGRAMPEGQSLQSTLRRGWFFGSEVFKEKLLALAERALKKGARRKNYKAAAEVQNHSEVRAEALVKAGLAVCKLDGEALLALPRGDWRKALIAQVVKAETTVPLGWIAGRLEMGARSTVSREIGAMAKKLPKDAKLRRLRGKILATDE
jgi:putative transposase